MKVLTVFIVVLVVLVSCKPPEARRPVTVNSGTSIDASVKRNRKLIEQDENRIKAIIKQDSLNTYIASEDGFWYYYTSQDTGSTKTAKFGDAVNYDYSISDLNGNAIYTNAETPTKTYFMDQEQLASGIRQGLKLLSEGEEAVFLLPAHKAYGYYGDNNKIGTNVPLRVTLKVNSITTQNIKEE